MVRDQVVDFVRRWSEKAEIRVGRFIAWLGVTVSKFYNWRQRYGRVNEHNGWVPRDFWLELWEKTFSLTLLGFSSLCRLGLRIITRNMNTPECPCLERNPHKLYS